MKIKPSIRYQLHDQRLSFLVYYGVMVGMILLNLLFLPFAGGSDLRITSGGITAVTSIFFFIVGLYSFKEPFLLGLQHGISRRSQFLARLASMGIGCAFLALADEIYTLLVALLKIPFPNSFFAFSLYEMVYGGSTGTKLFLGLGPMDEATASASHTAPTAILLSIVFSFFVLLVFNSFGYLVTTLNYRLGKTGKIILWCGWPALLMASGVLFDANPRLASALAAFMVNLTRLCFSTLPRMCLTCLVLTALFSALTWLLMRRANAK